MTCRVLLLAMLLAVLPAAPALAQDVDDARIDRLLEVMDMSTMLDGMMQQMSASQEAMVVEAFGQDLSKADRAKMQSVMVSTHAKVRERMSWEALSPIIRRVYAQLFTAGEVDAMIAFYSSPEGASILQKSPQAMALTMQEMQPLMMQLMTDLQSEITREAKSAKE